MGERAHYFHRKRALVSGHTVNREPLRFYINLLRFPLRSQPVAGAVVMGAIFAISQPAIIAGFFWQGYSHRGEPPHRPAHRHCADLVEPLISVIIPAYNAARTIRETLCSVLAQTHRRLEVIVVDDGSNDETAAIAEAIRDGRVQVKTVPNQGPAATRNRGFVVSRGEYVSFLDADDLWSAEKIADQLAALQSHPRAGVAYSWTDYIDEQGEPFCSGSHRRDEGAVYAAMLVGDFLENGSNALLRRETAEALGGFDEQVPRGSEDWEYFIRAARLTEFVCVPKPQILYRISSNSVSANIEAQISGLVQMIEKAYSEAPPNLRHLQQKSLAHIYMHLASKALDSISATGRSRLSLRLLGKALIYQPSLLASPFTVSRDIRQSGCHASAARLLFSDAYANCRAAFCYIACPDQMHRTRVRMA